MIGRDEIRRLCLEHDRFMAEARESLRRSPIRESDPGALVYKAMDNNALVAAPAADAEASDVETLHALNEFSAALVEKFKVLERENAYLRGQLDALLTLIGKSEKFSNMAAHSVVDLPKNFWKRDAAA
jgi:hypothetical protein